MRSSVKFHEVHRLVSAANIDMRGRMKIQENRIEKNQSGGIKYEHHRSYLIRNIWSDRRCEHDRMYREHSWNYYLEILPESEIS